MITSSAERFSLHPSTNSAKRERACFGVGHVCQPSPLAVNVRIPFSCFFGRVRGYRGLRGVLATVAIVPVSHRVSPIRPRRDWRNGWALAWRRSAEGPEHPGASPARTGYGTTTCRTHRGSCAASKRRCQVIPSHCAPRRSSTSPYLRTSRRRSPYRCRDLSDAARASHDQGSASGVHVASPRPTERQREPREHGEVGVKLDTA